MDRMLFNTCYSCLRLNATRKSQLCSPKGKPARTIHSSTFRAAKPSRPSIKKSRKQEPLEYRPSMHKPNIASQSLPKPKENPLRFRTIPIVGASVFLFGMASYMGYMYYLIIQPAPESDSPPTADFSAQEDVSTRYEKIARTFDSSVDSTESSMGITSLRRKLVSEAKGDVLEVSIGTGRNLDYYDWNFKGHGGVGKVDNKGYIKKGKVRSLTAVDKSGEMLEIAHEKFSKMFPGIVGVRWIIADAAEAGKTPGPPKNANERSGNVEGKYDTVLQTFGLCSVSDPVGLLQVMGDCVKEEEGRILLLEHGRGRWDWLNNLLDKYAEKHAKEFGCWWNRDVEDIVKQSGLEVVKIQTPKWWHGGTTWWIELKKPKSRASHTEKVEPAPQKSNPGVVPVEKIEEKPREPPPATPVVKKGWW